MVGREGAGKRHEMHVRLLGPVRALRDGSELDLGSQYRRALFAVLAMHANHPVSREQLVNALWGADAPPSAVGNLYTYVSTLRAALEPGRDRWSAGQVLSSGAGSYRLQMPATNIDVCQFDALRDRARELRTAGDLDAELPVLRSALELWQGEALAGIPGPFAQTQRMRLGELRLATVERQAAVMLEVGRHEDVITELRALAEQHPLRENLHGLLMTALCRAGRRTQALDVYRRVQDLLIEQAGTEPNDTLRQLYQRIAAGDTDPRPPDTGALQREPVRSAAGSAGWAAGAGAGGRPPFVGRAAQLRLLRRAVDAVRAGRGGSIWIDGEPGSGKSAVLTEALRDAGRSGCRVRWGVGDELARQVPLNVLLECFDPDVDAASGGVAGLVQALRNPAGELAGDPAATVDQALTLVQSVCARSPLILVVDDLQWADDVTLLVWDGLHRLTRRLPLLLIAATRPLPRRGRLDILRSLVAGHGAEMTSLPPLEPAEAAALARALAPAHGPALVDSAVASAGGNPCYLTHLLAADVTTGAPLALVSAVDRHLEPLTDEMRQILRALALLGEHSTIAELCAATGRSSPAVIHTVDQALLAGLLTGSVAHAWFRHPVVPRVLRDHIPTALRGLLHHEYAERIAKAGGSPEQVLRQLLAGPARLDAWAAGWLVEHADALSVRMPEATTDALRRATAQPALEQPMLQRLTACLGRHLLRRGLAANPGANRVKARTSDPALPTRLILDLRPPVRGRSSTCLAPPTIICG
ncbi:DNA-binding SARP family transcriptional activator [Krasilnikovia cinnamomea]|uniref:DNA-binding SARP family transcriptional activator n=1 Tax=Krasilnikovia cinnamomea TaxID=349313 RepID=A0A4Q7ZQU7_9ACTN|nr:BTAD domain-containing putative transcriptional regulator [Krasilnikovia cinnamomea]RZU53487.1 DNA-binding SARP family transcriptional activator [Krasilnikovia cinnamomea]